VLIADLVCPEVFFRCAVDGSDDEAQSSLSSSSDADEGPKAQLAALLQAP